VRHDRFLGGPRDRYSLVFTFDDTLPRNKASLPLWVGTLETLLTAHPADDALRNRVRLCSRSVSPTATPGPYVCQRRRRPHEGPGSDPCIRVILRALDSAWIHRSA